MNFSIVFSEVFRQQNDACNKNDQTCFNPFSKTSGRPLEIVETHTFQTLVTTPKIMFDPSSSNARVLLFAVEL